MEKKPKVTYMEIANLKGLVYKVNSSNDYKIHVQVVAVVIITFPCFFPFNNSSQRETPFVIFFLLDILVFMKIMI